MSGESKEAADVPHAAAPQPVVAWMHAGYTPLPCRANASAQAAHLYVISDAVKQLWLAANPQHVEHYTIPLYGAPLTAQSAVDRG